MPPLPADSIHARACKLKCEKILTRPTNAFERRVHLSKDCIRRSQLKTIIRRNNYAYNE